MGKAGRSKEGDSLYKLLKIQKAPTGFGNYLYPNPRPQWAPAHLSWFSLLQGAGILDHLEEMAFLEQHKARDAIRAGGLQ